MKTVLAKADLCDEHKTVCPVGSSAFIELEIWFEWLSPGLNGILRMAVALTVVHLLLRPRVHLLSPRLQVRNLGVNQNQ
jgi:hypothetical protein